MPEPGPLTASRQAGPGNLHFKEPPLVVSPGLWILGRANRGFGGLCRGSGRPAPPCGAARLRSCGASCQQTHCVCGRSQAAPRGKGQRASPIPRIRGLHLLSKPGNFPSQEDPVLERYFKGHKAAITSVDFSPNGKQLGKFYSFFLFVMGQTLSQSVTLSLSTLGPRENH